MTDTYLLQVLSGLHIVAAAVFVGSNVLLHLLVRRLDLVPPSDAAILSTTLGLDITILNSGALIVAGGTGLGRIIVAGDTSRYFTTGFWGTSYGLAMACMIGLWLTLVATAIVLAYLRTQAVAKLPFDATREEVEERSVRSLHAAGWIARVSWFNLAAGIALLLIGGFLRYGGFVSAAAGASPAARGSAAAGRRVFVDSGCGGCHTLAAVGSAGKAGPDLDRVTLTEGQVVATVSDGKGGMPAYRGRLNDRQIADLARLLAR